MQQKALAFVLAFVAMTILLQVHARYAYPQSGFGMGGLEHLDTRPSPYAGSHPGPGQPDPYAGVRNTDTGWGCCGGRDCMELDVTKPENLARMEETADEIILDGQWHFPKKGALPSFNGNYHFCIWGGKPRCLFIPQAS